MNAHELAEKIRNSEKTESNFQEVIKWCRENVNNIDLMDNNHHYLYEIAMKYLMNCKIGRWDKDDAIIVINFLAKKNVWSFGIAENVTVKVFEEDEYKQIYGNGSAAICVSNYDNIFNIAYSPEVVNNLLSNNYDKFLRGMQMIFHEAVHAKQNSVIQHESIKGVDMPKTKTIYIMALETIARKYDPKFYKENYDHLLKENHAEKIGLSNAMEIIKKYNSKLYKAYNQDVIAKRLENYERNFNDAKATLQSGKSVDFILNMDTLCSLCIEQHPEIINKFPILKVGYNLDGTKKDIIQLIVERDDMLNSGETPERIDDLYATIINRRNVLTNGLDGSKKELLALKNYIIKNGTNDEFIFDIIRFRLENKSKMTPEEITKIMEKIYDIAAKVNQEKQENNQKL